jgi:hypothetical protein
LCVDPLEGITQFAHIALKMNDIEKSLDFYVNKAGLPGMSSARARGASAAPTTTTRHASRIPDCNRIEPIQMMPKAMQFAAIASLKSGNT